MERLIKTWDAGGHKYNAIIACENQCKNNHIPSCYCAPMMSIRKRLTAYEDTGLTPEEITALCDEVEKLRAETAALESDKINADMNLENLTAQVDGLSNENAVLNRALKKYVSWEDLLKAQYYLEDHIAGNKSRLRAVNQEIRRRQKEAHNG